MWITKKNPRTREPADLRGIKSLQIEYMLFTSLLHLRWKSEFARRKVEVSSEESLTLLGANLESAKGA